MEVDCWLCFLGVAVAFCLLDASPRKSWGCTWDHQTWWILDRINWWALMGLEEKIKSSRCVQAPAGNLHTSRDISLLPTPDAPTFITTIYDLSDEMRENVFSLVLSAHHLVKLGSQPGTRQKYHGYELSCLDHDSCVPSQRRRRAGRDLEGDYIAGRTCK